MVDCQELIQYIIINKDLNMSSGKIAAAAAHAATTCTFIYLQSGSTVIEKWASWYYDYKQKKIILQAHQSFLEKYEDNLAYFRVRDIGCNEVEPNSLTAISLGIMTREEAEPIVKRLQIYK